MRTTLRRADTKNRIRLGEIISITTLTKQEVRTMQRVKARQQAKSGMLARQRKKILLDQIRVREATTKRKKNAKSALEKIRFLKKFLQTREAATDLLDVIYKKIKSRGKKENTESNFGRYSYWESDIAHLNVSLGKPTTPQKLTKAEIKALFYEVWDRATKRQKRRGF